MNKKPYFTEEFKTPKASYLANDELNFKDEISFNCDAHLISLNISDIQQALNL
jgi:hypothetical protein